MKICAVACLFVSLRVMPATADAGEGLKCDPIAQATMSKVLTPADSQALASGENVDIANLVSDLVNRLQVLDPTISYAHLVDLLVAAYCPIVANVAGLSLDEEEGRVREFADMVRREAVVNPSPPGTFIIANVPLSPDVYRKLSLQAATQKESVAQLLAKILTLSAGQ
jgi:hypothetical protein